MLMLITKFGFWGQTIAISQFLVIVRNKLHVMSIIQFQGWTFIYRWYMPNARLTWEETYGRTCFPSQKIYKARGALWGDLNVIVEVEEKLGGTLYRLEKTFEFLNSIEDFCVKDAGFSGNIVMWYNNRDAPSTILKRLYKILYNSKRFDLFFKTTVSL